MVGKRIRSEWYGVAGVVKEYKPLDAGTCDTLVACDNGKEVWIAAAAPWCQLEDGSPIPNRAEVRRAARDKEVRLLRKIRKDLINEWLKPWPGAEHGKVIIGNCLSEALKSPG